MTEDISRIIEEDAATVSELERASLKCVLPAQYRGGPLGYIDERLNTVDRWLAYSGMAFLIGLMVMVVVQVTARYVFNSPIKAYIDLMEMMMAVLVFLSLAYSQMEGGNIRIELFMTKVIKERRRYFTVELIHLIIALLGFAFIAYFSAVWAQKAYVIGDTSPSVHWPIWPARMFVAIGAVSLCVRLVWQILQSLTQIWSR